MRKLFVAFIVLILLSLSACREVPSQIDVISIDYPSMKCLQEGTFNPELEYKWWYYRNPYHDYVASVSVVNGRLCVSNQAESRKSYLQCFDNGYFMGVDIGEFDGWVKYYPYFSLLPEAGSEKLVSNQNCRGIIARDHTNGYILTVRSLYAMNYENENRRWEWRLIQSFDSGVRTYLYLEDRDILFIVTAGSIVSVSADFQVATIAESEILKWMETNSIVFYDGSLWCGASTGVYRYCFETDEEQWYPVNYAKYVK